MPQFVPLEPLSSSPVAVVLLQTLECADDWEADRVFWSGMVESLPPGSRLVEARPADESVPSPGEGVLLARALENIDQPRLLVVPAGRVWRQANLFTVLASRLDHAHMVVLARPLAKRTLPARWLHGLSRMLLRVLLALDMGEAPGWPGWRRWSERLMGWWFLGVRGTDPFSPCRMLRLEVALALGLQSQGSMVHGEISAKANYLGALIDEEPGRVVGAVDPMVPDSRWWRDFRELFHHPRFAGRPLGRPETRSPEPVGVP